MTTQLRTTPATAAPSTKAPRKATKDAAKDPGDQAAEQFAAMFASLCLAPKPQPQGTPVAKPQEVAPSDFIANPEIAGSDATPAPPIPIVTLPPVATVTDKAVPEILAQESSLPLEPVPESVWPAPIPGPSSPPLGTETSLPAPPIAETISPLLMKIVPPLVIKPAANTGVVDPIQTTNEATSTEVRARSVAEAPGPQDQQIVANNNLAQQLFQTEAARRDANLVAGYLATITRNDRDGSGVAGVKAMLAGNAFDLHGGDRQRDSDVGSQVNLLPGLADKASFAATVRDFEAAGGASSVPSQTIRQIMALAETVGAQQTRSLRLRLRPEELGQIDIQLSRDAAGRISAHISAERESARGALSRSLDQLRDTLSRAGLTVDKLQISAGPGLFAGNRESDDGRSNTRESPSATANLLIGKETEAGGQPRAEEEKLLSLRA